MDPFSSGNKLTSSKERESFNHVLDSADSATDCCMFTIYLQFYSMAILEEDIRSSLQQGKIPQLCIGPLAKKTNGAFLDALADFCYSRWPYWFRVRVNDYWEGNVFKVANLFNDRNIAR